MEITRRDARKALRGILLVIAFFYAFGGLIGAVYWALAGWMPGVILSIFVPFFGIVSIAQDIWSFM